MKEVAFPAVHPNPGSCGEEVNSLRIEPAWARSAAMRQVLLAAERLASTRTAVLLTGEYGVGKDWIAQLIHRRSQRSGLFVPVSMESVRPGQFEALPAGTTILIQEVGSLSREAQARLGELLDGIDFGGSCGVPSGEPLDLRVVATSTQDLALAIQEGAFLSGLYYRLAAADLRIPPLRERKEDIEGLVAILLSELEQKYDLGPFVVTDALLEAFRHASWPGNVRQLRAVLEKAILLSEQDLLDLEALPAGWNVIAGASPFEVRIGTSLADVEKQLILETLRAFGGHKVQAAEALGISRRKLHYKLRQYREEGLPV